MPLHRSDPAGVAFQVLAANRQFQSRHRDERELERQGRPGSVLRIQHGSRLAHWYGIEGQLRVELGGSISIGRMTANGAKRKPGKDVGSFRSAPQPVIYRIRQESPLSRLRSLTQKTYARTRRRRR